MPEVTKDKVLSMLHGKDKVTIGSYTLLGRGNYWRIEKNEVHTIPYVYDDKDVALDDFVERVNNEWRCTT